MNRIFFGLMVLETMYGMNDFIQYHSQFHDYQQKFKKMYSHPTEYEFRFHHFIQNQKFIHDHNSKQLNFKLGWNEFTDMSNQEFKSYLTLTPNNKSICKFVSYQNQSYASDFDWREKQVVSEVKNQKSCGSCWAFSTTGSIESLVAIYSGTLVSLSEQQLIDCSIGFGDFGCFGGFVDIAMNYVISNHGLCSEDSYPYTGSFDNFSNCDSNCTNSNHTNISFCNSIETKDERALGYFLSKQPISIGIQADSRTFQHYSFGVYDDLSCYQGQLNHAVLLVGLNDDSIIPFYWLKNSWGKTWGIDGYMKIFRNKNGKGNGICGLTLNPIFPSYE